MKKTKLVVAGAAILMSALLAVLECKDESSQQHITNVQSDSLQQTNVEAEMPVPMIGLPANL